MIWLLGSVDARRGAWMQTGINDNAVAWHAGEESEFRGANAGATRFPRRSHDAARAVLAAFCVPRLPVHMSSMVFL